MSRFYGSLRGGPELSCGTLSDSDSSDVSDGGKREDAEDADDESNAYDSIKSTRTAKGRFSATQMRSGGPSVRKTARSASDSDSGARHNSKPNTSKPNRTQKVKASSKRREHPHPKHKRLHVAGTFSMEQRKKTASRLPAQSTFAPSGAVSMPWTGQHESFGRKIAKPRTDGQKKGQRHARVRPKRSKSKASRKMTAARDERQKGVSRLHDVETQKRKENRAKLIAAKQKSDRIERQKMKKSMIGYEKWRERKKQSNDRSQIFSPAEHGDSMYRHAYDKQRRKMEETRARLKGEVAQMGSPKLTVNSLRMADRLEHEGRRPHREALKKERPSVWPARKERLEREAEERKLAFEALTASPTPSKGSAAIIAQRANDGWQSDSALSDRLVAWAPQWKERAEARRREADQAAKTLANRTCRTEPVSSEAELEEVRNRFEKLATPRTCSTRSVLTDDEEMPSRGKRASLSRLNQLAQPTSPREKKTDSCDGDVSISELSSSKSPRRTADRPPAAQVLAMRRRTVPKRDDNAFEPSKCANEHSISEEAGADNGEHGVAQAVLANETEFFTQEHDRYSWPEWSAAEGVLNDPAIPENRKASARAEFERASQVELPSVVSRWVALHEAAVAEVAAFQTHLDQTVQRIPVPVEQRDEIRASLEKMSENERADAMRKLALGNDVSSAAEVDRPSADDESGDPVDQEVDEELMVATAAAAAAAAQLSAAATTKNRKKRK